MARYEHLPIYKAAMEMAVYLDGLVRQFSRYHKYTTGQDLRNLARDIIKLVILARRRVVNNLKYKLDNFREEFSTPKRTGATVFQNRLTVDPDKAVALRQILASYLGHFQHASCHRLIKSIVSHNPWLLELFHIRGEKLALKAVPGRTFRSMRSQVAFFRRGYPGRVLLFQVGRFVEVYGADAFFLHWMRGFALRSWRRGMPVSLGFPAHMAPGIRNRILAAGRKTVKIAEGPLVGAIRQRYARELMWPDLRKTIGEGL